MREIYWLHTAQCSIRKERKRKKNLKQWISKHVKIFAHIMIFEALEQLNCMPILL